MEGAGNVNGGGDTIDKGVELWVLKRRGDEAAEPDRGMVMVLL